MFFEIHIIVNLSETTRSEKQRAVVTNRTNEFEQAEVFNQIQTQTQIENNNYVEEKAKNDDDKKKYEDSQNDQRISIFKIFSQRNQQKVAFRIISQTNRENVFKFFFESHETFSET